MTWQPAPVAPVDVELRVTAYLRPLLSAHVGTVRPTEATHPYPAEVVTVRRDGGSVVLRRLVEGGERLWLFYAHGGEIAGGWFCHGSFG